MMFLTATPLFLFAAVMVVYYTEGDVSLPRYGPLRSDAILWYVQIVNHSSTLYSCIWWGVFGIDCTEDLVSGQLNGSC